MTLQDQFAATWRELFPDVPWRTDEEVFHILLGEIRLLRACFTHAERIIPNWPARPASEFQWAHDVLRSVLIDADLRIKIFQQAELPQICAQMDVLCWGLQHGHNEKFAELLASVEQRMIAGSYFMFERGEL